MRGCMLFMALYTTGAIKWRPGSDDGPHTHTRLDIGHKFYWVSFVYQCNSVYHSIWHNFFKFLHWLKYSLNLHFFTFSGDKAENTGPTRTIRLHTLNSYHSAFFTLLLEALKGPSRQDFLLWCTNSWSRKGARCVFRISFGPKSAPKVRLWSITIKIYHAPGGAPMWLGVAPSF